MFHRNDFHWKAKRFIILAKNKQDAENKLKDFIVILNNLTPEQEEAVRAYGESMSEESCDANEGGGG
jgi:hypothetical protein